MAVEQVGDPGTTGNFEVTCAGQLIHSKTTRGQGKCQTGEETQRVIDAIQEAVDDAFVLKMQKRLAAEAAAAAPTKSKKKKGDREELSPDEAAAKKARKEAKRARKAAEADAPQPKKKKKKKSKST